MMQPRKLATESKSHTSNQETSKKLLVGVKWGGPSLPPMQAALSVASAGSCAQNLMKPNFSQVQQHRRGTQSDKMLPATAIGSFIWELALSVKDSMLGKVKLS